MIISMVFSMLWCAIQVAFAIPMILLAIAIPICTILVVIGLLVYMIVKFLNKFF